MIVKQRSSTHKEKDWQKEVAVRRNPPYYLCKYQLIRIFCHVTEFRLKAMGTLYETCVLFTKGHEIHGCLFITALKKTKNDTTSTMRRFLPEAAREYDDPPYQLEYVGFPREEHWLKEQDQN